MAIGKYNTTIRGTQYDALIQYKYMLEVAKRNLQYLGSCALFARVILADQPCQHGLNESIYLGRELHSVSAVLYQKAVPKRRKSIVGKEMAQICGCCNFPPDA